MFEKFKDLLAARRADKAAKINLPPSFVQEASELIVMLVVSIPGGFTTVEKAALVAQLKVVLGTLGVKV